MGMFDWVNVKMDCPKCGKLISGFQSKDSACCLDIIDPEYVSSLYTSCPHCKSWISFDRSEELLRINKPRSVPFSREEIEILGFVLKE